MSEILKVELMDENGNTYYLKTDSESVFCTDGTSVETKLNTKINTSNIVQNASTDDTTKVVSASVAKNLQDQINGKIDKTSITHSHQDNGNLVPSAALAYAMQLQINNKAELNQVVNFAGVGLGNGHPYIYTDNYSDNIYFRVVDASGNYLFYNVKQINIDIAAKVDKSNFVKYTISNFWNGWTSDIADVIINKMAQTATVAIKLIGTNASSAEALPICSGTLATAIANREMPLPRGGITFPVYNITDGKFESLPIYYNGNAHYLVPTKGKIYYIMHTYETECAY